MQSQAMPEIEGCHEDKNNNTMEKPFKQFDMVSDCTGHHFTKNSNIFQGSKAAKSIMQEWKILDKDLPETIFVRTYETRIDLLRAAIVGPQGTPYHDGLFFFDLRFPSNYPAHPPEVYYHSFNLSINPNLYSNGKVCLSLLNTWYGTKNERWNSKESTILQVLVSIQALVLNDHPYFNEPNRKKSGKSVEKKSLCYNQDVFALNCKTMLFVLSSPPNHFKELVSWHFRERAHEILSSCKAYMENKGEIGCLFYEGSSSSSMKIDVSKKFKDSMEVIYPKLLTMFVSNGSSLSTFTEMLEKEREMLRTEKEKALANAQEVIVKPTAVKPKDGFGKRVFNKVKKMFGLKTVKIAAK